MKTAYRLAIRTTYVHASPVELNQVLSNPRLTPKLFSCICSHAIWFQRISIISKWMSGDEKKYKIKFVTALKGRTSFRSLHCLRGYWITTKYLILIFIAFKFQNNSEFQFTCKFVSDGTANYRISYHVKTYFPSPTFKLIEPLLNVYYNSVSPHL